MSLANYYWIFIVVFVFAADRITKIFALEYLQFTIPINVLPILNFIFAINPGAAFGFLKKAGGWQWWLFGGIAIVVSVSLIIWKLKIGPRHHILKVGLALILGGTLGNLYDRVAYHYVIDFIDFYFRQWHYPTFNLADSAICIGAALLMIDLFKKKKS